MFAKIDDDHIYAMMIGEYTIDINRSIAFSEDFY